MSYILYRMPTAIPGDVNRSFISNIITETLTPDGSTGHPTAYGIAVVIDAVSGQVRMVSGADSDIAGILVRPFPAAASSDGLNVSTPPKDGPCDVLRSGYVGVKLSGDVAAARHGSVYVWVAAASGTHIVGGFEADPGTVGQTVPIAASFCGPADAGGAVEIAFRAGPLAAALLARKLARGTLAGGGSLSAGAA